MANIYTGETKCKTHRRIMTQLENERSSFISHYRDIAEVLLPRRPRFDVTDVNKGDRRNSKIIDSTGTVAIRTLRSGMMSGITSPARPWFRLTTPDKKLAEFEAVKQWLHEVTQLMLHTFAKSNLYNALPTVYGDMGTFGTAAMAMIEDFDSVVRFAPFAVGNYCLGNDSKNKVATFTRKSMMTVRQIVEQFGVLDGESGRIVWDNMSDKVQEAWERSNYEQWIEVGQVVMPNKEYNPNKLEAKHKRFTSDYFETGTSKRGKYDAEEVFLEEKGFDRFPILAPRWETTENDVYATNCPGMEALGDVLQLQFGERKSARAIDKMLDPALQGPSSLKRSKVSQIPGEISYVDSRDANNGLRPIHQVNFDISKLEGKQQQIRQRINTAFYADLFLAMMNSDRRQMTAREVEERHEEKLLALGPVLEQINQDLLDPMIDNTFAYMLAQDRLPPPPPELQGVDLKVEYISVMAQAQKIIGIGGIERAVNFIGQVAQAKPEALDKWDAEQTIDVYTDMLSLPPGIIRPDEVVEQIRAQRAQAQAQQQKMAMMQQAASSAKDLSQASLGEDNALSRMLGATA